MLKFTLYEDRKLKKIYIKKPNVSETGKFLIRVLAGSADESF